MQSDQAKVDGVDEMELRSAVFSSIVLWLMDLAAYLCILAYHIY